MVKYPNISVRLTGEDGNAFEILARVQLAMRRKGVTETEVKEFISEATSGDYDNLLQTCLKWVNVE